LYPKRWTFIWGALIGALLGVTLSVLRNGDVSKVIDEGVKFSRGDIVAAVLGVLTAWILATVVVLGFNKARGVIAVEDFVGAALVGFSVVFGTVEITGLSDNVLSDVTKGSEVRSAATPSASALP